MRQFFGVIGVGRVFSYAGQRWQKLDEATAKNLHDDKVYKFTVDEIVLTLEEIK